MPPRGGRRAGRPGASYQNRTDLQLPPTAGPSQQYGSQVAQLAAQQEVPMSAAPAPAVSPVEPAQPYQFPTLTPLDAPTQRPGEPVTAGLAVGPGAGPSLGANTANDDVEAQLRATYARFPTEQLRSLIEMIDDGDV